MQNKIWFLWLLLIIFGQVHLVTSRYWTLIFYDPVSDNKCKYYQSLNGHGTERGHSALKYTIRREVFVEEAVLICLRRRECILKCLLKQFLSFAVLCLFSTHLIKGYVEWVIWSLCRRSLSLVFKDLSPQRWVIQSLLSLTPILKWSLLVLWAMNQSKLITARFELWLNIYSDEIFLFKPKQNH